MPAESRVLRTTSQSIVIGLMGIVGLIATVNMSVHDGPSTAHGSTAAEVGGILLGALMFAAAGRLALCCAEIRPEGLRVRNPIRTRRVAWSDLAGFRIGRRGIWPRICIASLSDGDEIGIFAIQGRGPAFATPGRAARRLTDQLNDALALAQARDSRSAR